MSYANSVVIYTLGTEIPPNVPSHSGGPITRYSVSPALPPGMWLDAASGVISGTPQAVSDAILYTVSGSNAVGSATASVRIQVSQAALPPKSLRYANESPTYRLGQAITANVPIAEGGAISRFNVTPGLPSGLQLDPVTGAISGTPTAVSPRTNYTVTASNAAGSASVVLGIAVDTTNPAPTFLVYGQPNVGYNVGRAIEPNWPSTRNGTATLFTVVPTLPPGLSLNATTGVISGTPQAAQPTRGYTVTASNSAGATSTTLYITILSVGVVRSTGNMNLGRTVFSAVLLPNGKVLFAGGYVSTSNPMAPPTNTAELYDAAAGAWTFTGTMNSVRAYASATLLPNGKVLVAGGVDTEAVSRRTLNTAELYDPTTGEWTPTGSMSSARSAHSAALLPDGKVLVSGGGMPLVTLNTSEIYDPATGLWTPTAPLSTERQLHTTALLPNGEVLAAGGVNALSRPLATELYDPVTATWTITGSMSDQRSLHTSTVLSSGKVLVAGGIADTPGSLATAELYDPATGRWQATGSMLVKSYLHSATLLANGKLMVAGGDQGGASGGLQTIQIYDPTTGRWTMDAAMDMARSGHVGIRLLNGSVLIAGGANATGILNSARLYTPQP